MNNIVGYALGKYSYKSQAELRDFYKKNKIIK